MIASLLLCVLSGTQPAQHLLSTADTRAAVFVFGNKAEVLNLGAVQDKWTWCKNSDDRLIDHVWVGDKLVSTQWQVDRTIDDRTGALVTIEYSNQDPPLKLKSIWQARKGRGPIEHWIEIVNQSPVPVTIPEQESLDLSGIDPGGKADVWWVRRGATNALTEGGVFQTPIKAGMHLNLESNHQIPTSPVPWMAIQVGQSRGLYVGWEFSSLGRVEARTKDEHSVSLAAGLQPDFKTDILPGQTFVAPKAFVGCYVGSIDDGSNQLGSFVLGKLRATPPKTFPDPVTVLNLYLDAGSDKATTPDVLSSLSFAKNVGLDAFMCDAMWFPACGDWRWDPKRFPKGGRSIGGAIHADDMKFGLWCAWTNGGISNAPGALSVRGPNGHADWFEHDMPVDWKPGPFYGVSADMGCDAAKAWAIQKTQSLVAEGGVDLFKTDVNPMINNCTRTDHRHGYVTDVSYWSTLGVYEVWDRLRSKFPKVVLENCSGASHIKDFGVVQRCAYTTVTDTLSNLPDRAGIYDSTYILPPAALMTYTYERGYGLPGDDPGTYLFRSAMLTAWQLDPINHKVWTQEEVASAIASVKTYKEWLRPIIRECEVHHVLPRPDGKNWDGLLLWSPKLTKGVLAVFRPDSAVSSQTVKFAGLNPGASYRLWSEDGSIPTGLHKGRELTERGLSVHLPQRYSSDLIELEDAKLPAPVHFGNPGSFEARPPVVDDDFFGGVAMLHWSQSRGARSYHLTVSTRPDMGFPVIDEVCYTTARKLNSLLPDRDYFWQVTALNWGGATKGPVASFHSKAMKAWSGAFVSDLPWISANAGSSTVHRDVNLFGNQLSIGGVVFKKGIWTHSFDDGRPADIVVDLAGKGYSTFAASVGIDDASGGGSVQFQVVLDGAIVIETPVLRPGKLQKLSVNVVGAKTLTLRVLNGGDGYTSDHAVWGLARLIKAGAADPFSN